MKPRRGEKLQPNRGTSPIATASFIAHTLPPKTKVAYGPPPSPNPMCHHPFHDKARIPAFRADHLPKPSPQGNYNDDVNIPHFISAARSYADKQRKGLQEEHLDSLTMEDHLDGRSPPLSSYRYQLLYLSPSMTLLHTSLRPTRRQSLASGTTNWV